MRKTLLAALLVFPLAAQAQDFIRYYAPAAAAFTGGAITSALAAPAADNCAAVPYSFTGDTNTGLCTSAADTWNLYTAGASRLSGNSTAVTSTVPYIGTSTGNSITLCNTADCATNYEKADLSWVSNEFRVDVSSGGSGTARALVLDAPSATTALQFATQGTARWLIYGSSTYPLYPGANQTYDFGTSTAQVRRVWVSDAVLGGRTKALTEGAETAVVQYSVPQTGWQSVSVIIDWEVYAEDATDQQTLVGSTYLTAVNKAGTETCGVGNVGTPVNALSTGTLACTPTCVTGLTDAVRFAMNCTSSLTQTALSIWYRTDSVLNGSAGALTITPQ